MVAGTRPARGGAPPGAPPSRLGDHIGPGPGRGAAQRLGTPRPTCERGSRDHRLRGPARGAAHPGPTKATAVGDGGESSGAFRLLRSNLRNDRFGDMRRGWMPPCLATWSCSAPVVGPDRGVPGRSNPRSKLPPHPPRRPAPSPCACINKVCQINKKSDHGFLLTMTCFFVACHVSSLSSYSALH